MKKIFLPWVLVLFISCEGVLPEKTTPNPGEPITGTESLSLDFTGTGPVDLKGLSQASPVLGIQIKGINRLVFCAVDSQGAHVYKNESLTLDWKDGRLAIDVMHLLKQGLQLGMLILVDDVGGNAFLVRPRTHGSLKLLGVNGNSLRLDKEAYILKMDRDGLHAPLNAGAADYNHGVHSSHSQGDCDGSPWCLFPDSPVTPPGPMKGFMLEVREPNPTGNPNSPDPNELFPLTSAFYRLSQGNTTLASGTLSGGFAMVPWTGTGRFLTLLVEKPGYEPEMWWLDAVPTTGSLAGEGQTTYLDTLVRLQTPILVTLSPATEAFQQPKILNWDVEGENLTSETWSLKTLNADGTLAQVKTFDITAPGSLSITPLNSGQFLTLEGPGGSLQAPVKIDFRGENDLALGTWILKSGTSSYLGQSSFKNEGTLPAFGYGPTEYPCLFLKDKADLFTSDRTSSGIHFTPVGNTLFPRAVGWP